MSGRPDFIDRMCYRSLELLSLPEGTVVIIRKHELGHYEVLIDQCHDVVEIENYRIEELPSPQ